MMVNGALTTVVLSPATAVALMRRMDFPFIHGRAALSDASELMQSYGDDARREAASRAARSRDDGNVMRFCHWRQIERLIASLNHRDARGTVH
jgi:hypothetical protein